MTNIWVCDFFSQGVINELLNAWVTADWQGTPELSQVEHFKKHRRGYPIEASELPIRMIGKYSDKKVGTLPEIFSGNSFLVVTQKVTEVLRDFNLGNGGFYPLQILENDGVTPVEGHYFIYNVGNQKRTVLPEESRNVRKARGNSDWCPFYRLHDDENIAVLASSLNGPDIWIDPGFWDCIFFKEEVFNALHAQNLFGVLESKRCRII